MRLQKETGLLPTPKKKTLGGGGFGNRGVVPTHPVPLDSLASLQH